MFFNVLFVFEVALTLPPVHSFFKYFGSHDREPDHESQQRAAGRPFRLGSSLEFHLPPCRRDK
jgi:hypothetical protein